MFPADKKYPLQPQFALFQQESILVQFKKNSVLPIFLSTNHICDCLAVIIYSPKRGIAYLSHIFLRKLTAAKIEHYQNIFKELVKNHELNDQNTLVALIGTQNQTCHQKNKIRALLFSYFKTIFEDTGGEAGLVERCLLLKGDRLEWITIKNSKKKANIKKIFYQKENIPFSNFLPQKSTIKALTYYFEGQKTHTETSFALARINLILKNRQLFSNFQKERYNKIKKIHFNIQGICREYKKHLLKVHVLFLKKHFELNKKNASISIHNDLLIAVLTHRKLFCFLKTAFPLQDIAHFNADNINCFRYKIIQAYVNEKLLSLEEVCNMTPTAKQHLSQPLIVAWLLSVFSIQEILQLTPSKRNARKPTHSIKESLENAPVFFKQPLEDEPEIHTGSNRPHTITHVGSNISLMLP